MFAINELIENNKFFEKKDHTNNLKRLDQTAAAVHGSTMAVAFSGIILLVAIVDAQLFVGFENFAGEEGDVWETFVIANVHSLGE